MCAFDGSSFCSDFPKKLHQIASKFELVQTTGDLVKIRIAVKSPVVYVI